MSKRVDTNTKTKKEKSIYRNLGKRANTNTEAIKQRVYANTKTNTAKEYIQSQTRKRAHTDIKGIEHEVHIDTKTNKPKSTYKHEDEQVKD